MYNAYSKRNNLIKLTHYNGTERMAHNSQIIRAKENLKLSQDGTRQSKKDDNDQAKRISCEIYTPSEVIGGGGNTSIKKGIGN